MALGSAFDANFTNHRVVLAGQGICCIGVEFRNSIGGMVYGPDAAPAPFPIGVNDCMAGLEHIATNKEKYKYHSRRPFRLLMKPMNSLLENLRPGIKWNCWTTFMMCSLIT